MDGMVWQGALSSRLRLRPERKCEDDEKTDADECVTRLDPLFVDPHGCEHFCERERVDVTWLGACVPEPNAEGLRRRTQLRLCLLVLNC
jgi:hypothetical protein